MNIMSYYELFVLYVSEIGSVKLGFVKRKLLESKAGILVTEKEHSLNVLVQLVDFE